MFLWLWCGNVGELCPLGINLKTIWPNRFKSVIQSLVKESRTGGKKPKKLSLLPRDNFPSAPFCLTTFRLTARLARPCVPGRCRSPNNFPLITHRWWKNLSPPRRFAQCHLQNFSLLDTPEKTIRASLLWWSGTPGRRVWSGVLAVRSPENRWGRCVTWLSKQWQIV